MIFPYYTTYKHYLSIIIAYKRQRKVTFGNSGLEITQDATDTISGDELISQLYVISFCNTRPAHGTAIDLLTSPGCFLASGPASVKGRAALRCKAPLTEIGPPAFF